MSSRPWTSSFCALAGRGLAAAIAGLLVGVPSLRLKGDYLAIVTLGFGEIIRVIFTNMKSVGGALGLNSIPPYTNIFWVYRLCRADGLRGGQPW